MNKMTCFLLLGLVVLGCMFMTTKSKAQEKNSFANVFPFVAGEDRVGFFDQKTGRVYVYDNNLTQCLFIGQMTDLGKPIQSIMANNPTDNSPGNNLNPGQDQWNDKTTNLSTNTTAPSQ